MDVADCRTIIGLMLESRSASLIFLPHPIRPALSLTMIMNT